MSGLITAAVVVAGGAAVAANQQKQAAKGAANVANAANQSNIDTSNQQYYQTRQDYAPYRQAGTGALNLLNRAAGIATPATKGTFDSAAYLAANPDVAAADWARADPYDHYLKYGQFENRPNSETYFTGGTPAVSGTPDLSAFAASPGYQFRLAEGQKAGQNQFAARGGAFSGNALKTLSDYNQGMASNEFSNWWNQLQGLVNTGATGTSGTANAGAQNVNNIINSTNQNSLAQQNALTAQGDARASGVLGVTNALSFGLGNYGGSSGGYDQWGSAALNNNTPFYKTIRRN